MSERLTPYDWAWIAAKAAVLLSPIVAAWWFYPWVAVRLLESPILGPLLLAYLRKG